MKCKGCNIELKKWEPDDCVCSRCGTPICNHCGVIDMGDTVCNNCCDAIVNDDYRCYSCNHFILDNDIVSDYPECRCKDSALYRCNIFSISIEEETACTYYNNDSRLSK